MEYTKSLNYVYLIFSLCSKPIMCTHLIVYLRGGKRRNRKPEAFCSKMAFKRRRRRRGALEEKFGKLQHFFRVNFAALETWHSSRVVQQTTLWAVVANVMPPPRCTFVYAFWLCTFLRFLCVLHSKNTEDSFLFPKECESFFFHD